MNNGVGVCTTTGIMKNATNKSIPGNCPGCGEELRQVEADFMAKNNLEKCVKCRQKAEKPVPIKK